PRVAALVGRNVGTFLGGLFSVFLLAEEVKEVDRLLGRRLGDEEAVDAAEGVGRLAFAAWHDREGKDADVFFWLALAARRAWRLHTYEPFDQSLYPALAVAEDAGRLGVLGREVARLERLQRR